MYIQNNFVYLQSKTKSYIMTPEKIEFEISLRDARRATDALKDNPFIWDNIKQTSTNTFEVNDVELAEEVTLHLEGDVEFEINEL